MPARLLNQPHASRLQTRLGITTTLNRLTYNDAAQVRALFSELIGKPVDDSFLLVPPFYTSGGKGIHIGQLIFINHNFTFYDWSGITVVDDVMIGPNVSHITCGHPFAPPSGAGA